MTEIENIIANKEFGFSGKHGGTIDIVAGSAKAQLAASQILAPLGNLARESAIGTAAMAAASVAALGQLDPSILGAGALAGVVSSITKRTR